MIIRMKSDYFEMFENGGYRPLFFNFVYTVDQILGEMLIGNGMADPLEIEIKKADNEKKELKDVIKPKPGVAKSKKPRASDGSREPRGFSERVKKRSKN